MLRAANTGISAAFDARGHELGRIGLNRSGILVVQLPSALSITPYARVGLWLPLGLALLAVAIGISARLPRPARRDEMRPT